jgi:hypothetical protein
MGTTLVKSSGWRTVVAAVAVVAIALAGCSDGGSDKRATRRSTSTSRPATSAVVTTTAVPAPAPSTSSPTTARATPTTTVAPTPTQPATPSTSATTVPPVSDQAAKSLAVAKVAALGRVPGEFAGFGSRRLGAITTNRSTADGKGILVAFFDRGRYLGSDSKQESIDAQIASSGVETVTVSYRMYSANDPLCCPTGGLTKVRFRLDGQRLVALDPIPPISGAHHR